MFYIKFDYLLQTHVDRRKDQAMIWWQNIHAWVGVFSVKRHDAQFFKIPKFIFLITVWPFSELR